MGVNHRVFSGDLLRQAIVDAETSQQPIDLLTLTNGYYADLLVDYHGGLHSPHLSRNAPRPDLLKTILQPRRNDQPSTN